MSPGLEGAFTAFVTACSAAAIASGIELTVCYYGAKLFSNSGAQDAYNLADLSKLSGVFIMYYDLSWYGVHTARPCGAIYVC